MTQLEKMKQEISKITDPAEMAGLLDSTRIAAALYCKANYPNEVVFINGKLEDITVRGMCHYFESETN